MDQCFRWLLFIKCSCCVVSLWPLKSCFCSLLNSNSLKHEKFTQVCLKSSKIWIQGKWRLQLVCLSKYVWDGNVWTVQSKQSVYWGYTLVLNAFLRNHFVCWDAPVQICSLVSVDLLKARPTCKHLAGTPLSWEHH